MLDTIHEYALGVLDASPAADEIHRRHAEFFLAVAESANLNAGRLDEADGHARAALSLADELRDRAGRVFGIGLLATIAAERGQLEHAGRLWGVVDGEDAVAPLGGWRRHREACSERIRAAAGADFDHGYAAGRGLSIDDGVALAMTAPLRQ